MAWFKKKPDPISDRARALNQQIAELEAEIKKLDHQLHENQRSSPATTEPATRTFPADPPKKPGNRPPAHEPIFEEVDQRVLASPAEGATTSHKQYNELGVKKYDLPALFRRIRNHLRGPTTTNPKLVSYLAAGGIQGLRPLRYEKRVARNRFILLVAGLFLVLLGLVWIMIKNSR